MVATMAFAIKASSAMVDCQQSSKSFREDKGPISENDCKLIMQIIEDTAIGVHNLTLVSAVLPIVERSFACIGTDMVNNDKLPIQQKNE